MAVEDNKVMCRKFAEHTYLASFEQCMQVVEKKKNRDVIQGDDSRNTLKHH